MKAALAALQSNLFFWREDALCRAILAKIFTVGMLTALVKAVAFGKELLVASRFGSSDAMDAFASAFVMWSFVIGVIGGSMPDALVPVYSKARERARKAADVLAANSFWIYLAQLVGATVLMVSTAHWVVPWFTLEYAAEKQALTLSYFYALTPFPIFWGLSMMLTLMLQANKKFVLAGIVPVIGPAAAAAFLIFGSGSLGIHALIFGTVIGALLQAVLLYVHFFRNHCQKIGFSLKSWLSEDMRLVVKTMIPYLLAGVVMESTVIVDVGMAGMLDSGSVSVLTYAERVCAIGLTLALTAVSGAIYPYLADLVAQERWIELRRTIYRFGGLTLVGSIPVIGIIWGGSEWIVGTLFERGEFTSDDTARVSVVLRWLSLQIPFFILAVLGSRVVCAMLASKFMLFTTFVNLGLNILFNYLFMQWIGLAGIALSTSMVYAFSAFMLFAYFHVQVNRRIREGSQTEEKAS